MSWSWQQVSFSHFHFIVLLISVKSELNFICCCNVHLTLCAVKKFECPGMASTCSASTCNIRTKYQYKCGEIQVTKNLVVWEQSIAVWEKRYAFSVFHDSTKNTRGCKSEKFRFILTAAIACSLSCYITSYVASNMQVVFSTVNFQKHMLNI